MKPWKNMASSSVNILYSSQAQNCKTMEKKIRKNFELTKLSNGLVRVKMWSVGGDCYCQAIMFCTNQLWKVLAGNDTLQDRNQLAHQVLSIGDIYTKTGILMPKTEKNIKWN